MKNFFITNNTCTVSMLIRISNSGFSHMTKKVDTSNSNGNSGRGEAGKA